MNSNNSIDSRRCSFKHLHIADMCVIRYFESEHYNLRSAVRGELVVPLARKSTLGRHSFKSSGSPLWNALPHDIRDSSLTFSQFKSGLKTIVSWGVLSITASAFVMVLPWEGALSMSLLTYFKQFINKQSCCSSFYSKTNCQNAFLWTWNHKWKMLSESCLNNVTYIILAARGYINIYLACSTHI